jgi:predicted RNase H-like nuclease (RuvC/YqgF family)
MKKTYTITQVRQLLHVDNKTLARWLERADITPQTSKHDERVLLITREEVELLASIHERQLGELSVEREVHPTVKALTRRLEALERKVTDLTDEVEQLNADLRVVTEQLERLATASLSELESQLHDIRTVYLSKLLEYDPDLLKALTARVDALEQRLNTPARSIPAPRTRAIRPAENVSESSELPSDLVSARSFAKDHGIHENTLDKAIASGRLKPVTGRWKVGNSYVQKALDQAGRAIFIAMYRSNPTFRQCDDPACPCHE